MKKLIAFLLSFAMLLSLAACGGESANPGETDSVSNSTSSTKSTDAENNEATAPVETDPTIPKDLPAEDGGWTFRDMELPQIPALTWQEKEGYSLAETPIACDVEELYEYLQTMPYFAENYSSYSVNREESITFKDNEMLSAGEVDVITAQTGSGYVQITFYADPDSYINYYGVSVLINKVEMTDGLQNALVEAFDHAGLDAMEFVMRARDLDGKRANGDAFGGDETQDSMSERVSYDDYFYALRRTFLEGEDYYSFGYDVGGIWNSNLGATAKLFTPSYETMPYLLSDHFTDEFGGADPFEGASFGNALLASLFADYQSSKVNSLEYKVIQNSSGSTYYAIGCEVTYDNGENDDDDAERLQIGISYTIENDAVIGASAYAQMLSVEETQKGSTKESLFNEGIRVMQILFPGIDLSGIVYDENERSLSEKVSLSIFGTEINERFIIDYEDEDMTISLNAGFWVAL